MRLCFRCFVCFLLLVCLLSGCSNSTSSVGSPPGESFPEPPSGELSVAQVYNILKDCDFWYYAWYGTVMAYKGDHEITLQGESMIRDIQYYDGWIYYIQSHRDFTRPGFEIYRVRPDGEDLTVFFDSSVLGDELTSFSRLEFVEGYMYIQDAIILYRFDMQTNTIEQIGDVAAYHVAGNQMYYISHIRKDAGVYVLDLETGEAEILLGDGIDSRDKDYPKLYYRDLIFVGDVMYCTKRVEYGPDDYIIELLRYENGESTLIDSTDNYREFSLFSHDGRLFYIVWRDGLSRLKQYDNELDTVIELAICEGFRFDGKMTDEYFYYLDSKREVHLIEL